MRTIVVFLFAAFVPLCTSSAQEASGQRTPKSGTAKVGGKIAPDGKTELQIDLPDDQQQKNIGSPPPKGPGCCVFRSLDHASKWQNIPALNGMPEWMATHKPPIPGGGYPQKVTQLVAQIAKERGLAPPDILQVESADLEILKAATRSGRMPCVTYKYSPTPGRYGGKIAHMVNLEHADDSWFAVLDNNFIGEKNLQWLDPQTFSGVYTGGGRGNGWCVILLGPGPPPPPRNLPRIP